MALLTNFLQLKDPATFFHALPRRSSGAPVVVLPAGQSAQALPPCFPTGHTPLFAGVEGGELLPLRRLEPPVHCEDAVRPAVEVLPRGHAGHWAYDVRPAYRP